MKTPNPKNVAMKRFENLVGLPSEQLGEMVDATPSCHKIVTRRGELLTMNRSGLQLIEASGLDEVQGQSVYALMHPEDLPRFKAFNERICDGAQESLMFRIITLKGNVLWMESWAGPYELSNGEIAQLAITNNVTERVKIQATIEEQRLALERAFRMSSLGVLAAGLSHEINNPLGIIQGLADTLQMSIERGEATPTDISKDLHEISQTAARISSVVSELKRFEDEPPTSVVEQVDLRRVLDSIQVLTNNSPNSLAIDTALQTDGTKLVYANRSVLQQSLFYLMRYAQTALQGVPAPKIEWIITQEKSEPHQVQIRCTINRPNPNPDALMQSILSPFLDSGAEPNDATLGLSSMRRILLRQGGSLQIDKNTDVTTFCLVLPPSNKRP